MFLTSEHEVVFQLSPQDGNTLAHTLCIVIEYKTGSFHREPVFLMC